MTMSWAGRAVYARHGKPAASDEIDANRHRLLAAIKITPWINHGSPMTSTASNNFALILLFPRGEQTDAHATQP